MPSPDKGRYRGWLALTSTTSPSNRGVRDVAVFADDASALLRVCCLLDS